MARAEDQMLVAIEDYMPTDDTLLLTVKLRIKDKTGVDTFETLTTKYFSNGAYLGTILASNVLDAYPMNGQYNYYKGMSGNTGVIALKIGQPDIFWDDQYEIKAELSAKGQTKKVKSVNYDFSTSTLTYDVSDLVKGAIYRLDIIKKAKIVGRYAPIETGDGPPPLALNNTIYTSYFRVSTYDKVAEKVEVWKNSLKDKSTNRDISLVFEPNANMEPFDDYDLAQLKISFDLNKVSYFNNNISDFYYNFNPFLSANTFPCVAGVFDYYRLLIPSDPLRLVKSVSSPLVIGKAEYVSGQSLIVGNSKTNLSFNFPEKCNTDLYLARTWLTSEVVPYFAEHTFFNYPDCELEAADKIAIWTGGAEKFPTISTGSTLPFIWEYKVLNKVSYSAQQYGNNGSPLGNSNSLNNKITLTVGQ